MPKRKFSVRLSDGQRDFLELFIEKTNAKNLSEAMRSIIDLFGIAFTSESIDWEKCGEYISKKPDAEVSVRVKSILFDLENEEKNV